MDSRACVIYCRISDDASGEGLGVERQEADCRAEASRRGWRVLEVVVDNDVSGFRGRRPGFERLLSLVSCACPPVVLAYGQDRLARNMAQLERLLATGCEVRCLKSGDIDTTSPQGRLVARMLGAVAQGFSENMAADLKRKNLQKALAGRPRSEGGRRFGYTLDWRIVPAEAKAVRAAVASLRAGVSVGAVARDWRARGIVSPVGKPYAASSLRRMLVRPYLSARREHYGEVVALGQWPPILKVAEHDALILMLTSPSRSVARAERGPVSSYALTGTLECVCGARLYGNVVRGRRVYRCKKTHAHPDACSGVVVGADDVEGLVLERVAARIEKHGAAIARRRAVPDDASLWAELASARARRDEVVDMLAAGSLTRAQCERALARVDADIAGFEAELARHEAGRQVAALPTSRAQVEARWRAGMAKQLVRLLCASIVVAPSSRRGSHRFESERVRVAWR